MSLPPRLVLPFELRIMLRIWCQICHIQTVHISIHLNSTTSQHITKCIHAHYATGIDRCLGIHASIPAKYLRIIIHHPFRKPFMLSASIFRQFTCPAVEMRIYFHETVMQYPAKLSQNIGGKSTTEHIMKQFIFAVIIYISCTMTAIMAYIERLVSSRSRGIRSFRLEVILAVHTSGLLPVKGLSRYSDCQQKG